ncbi:MAG TPA: cytochrome P450 [Jatrophihabitans sp.]|uniref:cytochrome P450 n=1 Tax=Jatrophihabitans sp. TaxID=1932789 RepID=UPI002DF92216|nr:cytochrome P450 [Jatrophihabitans sp.]
MAQLTQVARFAAGLYRQKAVTAYHGYARHDPMALLQLGPARDNPYPIYERLRAEGPISRTRLGNWVSTSHPVCNRVLRDRHFGVRPEGPVEDDGFGLSFLELNPPDHTRLRRLATPAFSPKQMAGYRERIEKTVHQLIDDLPDGPFDLVPAFAAPLPIAVITDLLGIPNAHADDFAVWGATIGSALDGVKSLRHARELMAANASLAALFEQLFELRRRDPADDVISSVVAAEGERISGAEMVPLCTLLLIAGFETTVNLISNGVLALLDHPDEWAALGADPSLAANTVEGVLRFDPPVQRTARVALADVEVGGVTVRRGQFVATLIGGANRDPSVYAEPGRFDITRSLPVEHLAFSSGIHYCLGQPLARLEATIAFRVLAERRPGLRRAGRVVRRNAATIRGPLHLPLAD